MLAPVIQRAASDVRNATTSATSSGLSTRFKACIPNAIYSQKSKTALAGKSMSKLSEEIAQGTAEARAYMEGKRKGYKMTLSESIERIDSTSVVRNESVL
jgi:hypothetical protein